MADQEYKVQISLDGAQQAASGAQKVDSAIGGIGKRALEAGVAMFAAGGIIAGLQKITELSARAVEVNKVEKAFLGMSNKSGLAANTLDKLRTATRGAVSDFDLMRSANTIMLLGVTKSSEQMTQMAEISRRLGSAVGLDAVSALNSLSVGLGRQSPQLLDNLGITVRLEESYKKYADSLGKTADQLTDAEKKIGFMNDTMDKARDKVKTLGDDTTDAGDALYRLNAEMQNMKDNFDWLIPIAEDAGRVINLVGSLADLEMSGDKSSLWQKAREELTAYLSALDSGLGAQFANRLVSTHGDGLVEMFGKLRAEVEQAKKDMGNSDFADNLIKQIDAAQKAYDAAAPERAAADAAAHAKAIEAETAARNKRLEANIAENDAIATQIALRNEAAAFTESMIVSTDDEIASLEDYDMAMYATADTLDYLNAKEAEVARLEKARAAQRQAIASQTIGQIAGINQALKGSGEATKRILQVQATVDAYAAANAAFDNANRSGFPLPLALGIGGVALAYGLGNVAQIQSQSYREGTSFVEGPGGPRQDGVQANLSRGESILNTDTTARLGRDTIDRLNNGGSAGVTVNIYGMVGTQDFVRNTLIPEFEKSLRRRLA